MGKILSKPALNKLIIESGVIAEREAENSMVQIITAPAEKRWVQMLLFPCRSNDFGPILLAFHEKKRWMAAIIEILSIAVLTNLIMLVIRLTERKKT